MRIKSFDLARGFTVLCIPAVHTVLLYSQPSVRETLFGQLLRFVAEGPGAQLFMLYLGLSLTLSVNRSWPAVLKRSGLLLMTGYGLNVVKFVVPLQFHWLPLAFQTDLGIADPNTAALTVFCIGDILHFAALALPITYAIYRLPNYGLCAIAAAVIVAVGSPYAWDHSSCTGLLHYCFQLIGGQPPAVYFPLFPWLTYPFAGLAIGYYIKREQPNLFLTIGLLGCCLILLGHVTGSFDPPSTSFYRTRPSGTATHLGIVGVWLWIWQGIAQYSKPNVLFRFLQYASRSITQLYLIQWLLISWFLPEVGYQSLRYSSSIAAVVFMTGGTLFLSLLINAGRKEGIVIEE